MSLALYEEWDTYHQQCYTLPAETDPVHGIIRLGWAARVVMSKPAMKRLKNLKQLGATSSWCHAAEHTRFTHSRGVAHLAQKFGLTLKRRYPELELRARDISHLEVAGAVHDIGHGPLSHAFQDMFMPRANHRRGIQEQWEHEEMSCKLIEHMKLTEDPDLDFDQSDVRRVKELVMGEGSDRVWGDKRFLLGVVAAKDHGVDVDRMDYIARDALMCNQTHVPNLTDALIDAARVVDDKLCFDADAKDVVQNFFKARSDMHMKVYQTQKTRQAEVMMMDALLLADHEMKIVENYVDNVEAYVHLDDTVLSEIKRMNSQNAFIVAAQKLLNRLDAEDLYLECAEVSIPPEKYQYWKAVTEEDVLGCMAANSGVALREEDISVQNVVANMGKKCMNPLTMVPLVRACNPGKILYETPTGARMVHNCEERVVRVYLRKQVPRSEQSKYCTALHDALCALMRERGVDEDLVIKKSVPSSSMPCISINRKRPRSPPIEDDAEPGSSRGNASSADFARPEAGTSQSSDAEDDFTATQTQYGTQYQYCTQFEGTQTQFEEPIICSQMQD